MATDVQSSTNMDDLEKLIGSLDASFETPIPVNNPSRQSVINQQPVNVDSSASGASGFDALDGLLNSLEGNRMSVTPGPIRASQIPQASVAAPSPQSTMGPSEGGAGRGVSGGRGISSGPGAAFAKGGISSGPGAAFAKGRGVVSAGPGAAWANKKQPAVGEGVEIKMAEYTPDGRKIIATGPPCAACTKMILGKVTNAMGKTFHKECFRCKRCDMIFKDGAHVEHENEPYCDPCYTNFIMPKCCKCSLPIKDRVVNWKDKVYHPEHFSCCGCGTCLSGKGFKEWEDEPYCTACYKERERWIQPAAHMCARCKKPIFGEYLKITGEYFHPEHFKCEACGKDLYNGDCHEYDGKLYCEEDYRKLLKHVCFGCRKPITGRSLTALGRVWHPEHFVCAMCFVAFADSNFFEHEGKPYCRDDYSKHFAQVCAKCQLPVIGTAMFALGKYWHNEHYICHFCDKPLSGVDQVLEWETKPMCRPCYFNLPKEVRSKYEKQKAAAAKAAERRQKEDKQNAKREEKEMAKARKAEMAAQAQNGGGK